MEKRKKLPDAKLQLSMQHAKLPKSTAVPHDECSHSLYQLNHNSWQVIIHK